MNWMDRNQHFLALCLFAIITAALFYFADGDCINCPEGDNPFKNCKDAL